MFAETVGVTTQASQKTDNIETPFCFCAHTDVSVCLWIRMGLRALRQSCTHKKDFDKKINKKKFQIFTPTSTAAFNMWNTSSTNPELVLSRFLRSACNLSQLGSNAGAGIYSMRSTCTPTCTHTHRLHNLLWGRLKLLFIFCIIFSLI